MNNVTLEYLITVHQFQQIKMSHSIHMLSIQIDTKSLEQHQIVLFCNVFFHYVFLRLLDTLVYILVSRKGKHVFQEKSTAMTSSSPGIVHPFFFTSSNDEDDEGEEHDSSDSQHLLSYLLVCL